MSKHVMCSCGGKFHNLDEWYDHYSIHKPIVLGRGVLDQYRDKHHIVKKRIKNNGAASSPKVVRDTSCRTMRQVSVFLAKYGVYIKHGMLWRMDNGARVSGYAEKMNSGRFSISMHL